MVQGKYETGSMLVKVSDDEYDWKRFKRNMSKHGRRHFDKDCRAKNIFLESISSLVDIVKSKVGHAKPSLIRYGGRHPNTYTVTYKCDHSIGGIKKDQKIIRYTSAIDVVISRTSHGYWAVTYVLPSMQIV